MSVVCSLSLETVGVSGHEQPFAGSGGDTGSAESFVGSDKSFAGTDAVFSVLLIVRNSSRHSM